VASKYFTAAVNYFTVILKDLSAAREYLGAGLKSCKAGPEDVSEGVRSLGAARGPFLRQPSP